MPRYKKYKGESPLTARQRIARNKRQDKQGRPGSGRRGSAFNRGLAAGRGRNESGGIPYNPFKPIKSDPPGEAWDQEWNSPGQGEDPYEEEAWDQNWHSPDDEQNIEAVWDSPGWDGREPEWDWGTLSGDDQENEGPSDFGSPEEPGTPSIGPPVQAVTQRPSFGSSPKRRTMGRKKLPKTYKLKPFKRSFTL